MGYWHGHHQKSKKTAFLISFLGWKVKQKWLFPTLARTMHRFSSRGAESAGLTRRATGGPHKRTVGYVEEAY